MKTFCRIFFLFSVVLFIACNGKNRNTSDNTRLEVSNALRDITNMDSLYNRLSYVELPFTYPDGVVTRVRDYVTLPESMYSYFPNSADFRSDVYIAKLPQSGSKRTVVVFYNDSLENSAIDMYTLSPERQVIDRLALYSIERVEGTIAEIVRKYDVRPENRIRVYKELNNTLIESLFYTVTEDGYFTEIRDGETPATAFESFDNVTYYVETFVWMPKPNGGIEKTRVQKREYKLGRGGKVEEVQAR